MAQNMKVSDLEKELDGARDAFKGKRETGPLTSSRAKNVRFYHNSKTRHNACLITTENNEVVYKEFKEGDWLNIVTSFTRAKDLVVWYDKDRMVQQFVLNHEY
ncbi:MAG: hypothetical protein GX442_18375 [Candidatus Riflebacteria bacterium]|nr:hypothetical protein [Candidatus Riflebacteria bacterium]